jgi:hypothetical protein
MPVQRCQENGRPGWRWGREGKCYTHDGSDADSARARGEAEAQGQAIEAASDRGEGLLRDLLNSRGEPLAPGPSIEQLLSEAE